MRGKPNTFISSEYALLGLLYQNPSHGYELHKQISDPEGIGLIWRIKMSNLYALLDKLEQKGYISGIIQPGDSHPNRTEFNITDDGKTAFRSWLETTVKHPRDFRQEFMVRLYYVLRLQPTKINDLCQKQLQECNSWLENTQASNQQVDEKSMYKKSIIEFRVAQIRAIIHWLEATQRRFAASSD